MLNIKLQNNKGFTLLELTVVVSIMVVLSALMIINLNGQRSARELKIAQNNLVSNIKKVQSYTLSSRALPNGQAVQYYLLKFDLSKPTQYTIQAMYNTNSSPQYLVDVETVNLPTNIKFASISPIMINRQNNPTIQAPGGCALVAFAAPFSKIFFNDGCNLAGTVGNPSIVGSSSSTDDYKKVINYINNVDCVGNVYPICSLSTDSIMTITLITSDNKLSKTITINGITGSVSFN